MGDPTLQEAIREAAVTLLHREILQHGEVRLTGQDFLAADAAEAAGQAIQLNVGRTPDEVVFTHAQLDTGPVS